MNRAMRFTSAVLDGVTLRPGADDQVPYTKAALEQDLRRVEIAWGEAQSHRQRNAIYGYLAAVFDLVAWWAAERREVQRSQWALRLSGADLSIANDPFAAIIRCTSDPAKVDKRTRSKWSRLLRYALEYKDCSELLEKFIKRKGGINKCAARFTRCVREIGSSPGVNALARYSGRRPKAQPQSCKIVG
jgi:hypothetical protein